MIIIKLRGGLGNQMFQYALAKKLAIKNKTEVVFDLTFINHRMPGTKYVFRNFDLDIFSNIKNKTTSLSKAYKPFRNLAYVLQVIINKIGAKLDKKFFVTEKKQYEFDADILKSGNDCYLSGYWQNEKYFKDIKQDIMNALSKFTYPLSEKSLKLKEEINKTNSVCVNFRRTDYLTINTFMGNIDAHYYDNAVKLMSEKVKNPHLFVFSDDIEWCKENFKSQFPITFVDHSYAGKKFSDYLQLMISCKHYIIPNSTFAWWAAWLNPNKDKVIIAPKTWIISNDYDSSDMVPKEWIRI
jgi:hypothetical protein